MTATRVGVALVGVGAFGEFCLAAFEAMPTVQIVAVVDTRQERRLAFAAQYHATAYATVAELLHDERVQVVALNTPPWLHYEQGLAILNAGRHLFCEKPLALTVAEGEALLQAAQANHVQLTVDYVMRRNPLWQAAADLRAAGVFGQLLHMDLANHAAGLNLPPTHWFWDVAQSGGIWIEHGVHFFDAFAWVAGTAGEVTAAQAFQRQGVTDRVACLARYGDTAAHFYHGFTHNGHNEQTTVRLTFERAHLTLQEWVPTQLDIQTDVEVAQIQPLLPYPAEVHDLSNGQRMLRVQLQQKSQVYRAGVQAGLHDLLQAVQTPAAILRVTGQHGLDSLRMAVAATQASQ